MPGWLPQKRPSPSSPWPECPCRTPAATPNTAPPTRPADPPMLPSPTALRSNAHEQAGDVVGALAIADQLGSQLAKAGHQDIVAALAALAAGDLTVARTVEPHLDA